MARTQDDRGFEFGKRLIFDNRIHVFEQLLNWISKMQEEHDKRELIIGAEPTGYYWLSLVYYLRTQDINFVLVNPMHVKKAKELHLVDTQDEGMYGLKSRDTWEDERP